MSAPAMKKRTRAQLREHYEIEKMLANRLRNSGREERNRLYTAVYDELFRLVPHHPQLSRKLSPEEKADAVRNQMRVLDRFLSPSTRFMEIGAGSCHLSLEVSKHVSSVFAIDVSEQILKDVERKENLRVLLTEGTRIPVPENSIDLAYSYQLIEHLHPDDAYDQLRNIHRAVAEGGVYVCVTSNRFTGPHDISKYFEPVAAGLHLREYSATELGEIFLRAGFVKVRHCMAIRGRTFFFPSMLMKACERALTCMPPSWRRKVVRLSLVRRLLDTVIIVGRKGRVGRSN